jgi:ABC-type branched-subunit amino acid transport system substrate-binding protein
VYRGDQAFHYQDYSSAIASYRIYLDQVDHGLYTARTFYMSALAHYRLGQYDETLTTLDELARRYPKGRWVQVDALRGDAERALGHPILALQAWDAAWNIASDTERTVLRQRILKTARPLDDVELASAERAVATQDVRELLMQQMALRETPAINEPLPTEGEELPAAEEASTARAEFGAPAASAAEEKLTLSAKAEQPTEEVSASAPAKQAPIQGKAKVGCLFPLSGATGQFGERSLRGLRLIFGTDNDQLVIRDTGGRAADAARMFDELVRDPNVLAIIGPLQSDAAEALAPKADAAQVPLLLLSHGEVPTGRFVLQAGVTRAREVEALLDYATQKVRVRRFGVLYPDDQYGKELLGAFRAEVARRGGTVVGTDTYAPGGPVSVASALRTVKKWRDEEHLQALFVPDRAPAVAEFAKSVQDTMPDVMLLGTHGWEDLADHDSSLNGILFSDSFYSDSYRAGTRAFVDAYRQAYGEMPGITEAQAYDAGLLVRRALDAGASSRTDLWQRLHALGPVDGATGEIDLTPNEVRRTLFLLQVCDGKLQEIGAPVHAKPVEAVAVSPPATAPPPVEAAPPEMVASQPPAVAAPPPEVAPAVEAAPPVEVAPPVEAAAPVEAAPPEMVASQPPAVAAPPPEVAPAVEATPPVEVAPPVEAAVPVEAPPAKQPEATAGGPSQVVSAAPAEPEVAPTAAPVATKVACLLPLTGPDAAYGKRSLAGLQLAFADAPEQLIVHDTNGSPNVATAILRDLKSDPTVVAVIGPLRSSEAEATAPLAEREQVPLLLLSQREGLAGHFALQIAMTRSQQVRTLVRYAVETLNLRHFGILRPSNAYGSAFAASFKDEVADHGADVVGTQEYEPGTEEFSDVVAVVKSWGDKGVDGLFIPDAAKTAAPLAAEARRALPGVALLGTESWNDPQALASVGSAIDGAVFADAFFADSARPSTRRFVERFQHGAGRLPTGFEAEAFDAGLAVRQALTAGATSRDQMVPQLMSLGSLDGAGELRTSPTGFQRAVSILRYRDGTIEEVPPDNAGH